MSDEKRAIAKDRLNRLLKIPEGFSSEDVNELVDDIVSSAVLQISAIQQQAIEWPHAPKPQ